MVRPAKGRALSVLAGKLGLIRREVQDVLRGLKREILRREKELAALKAEYAQASDLLRGKTPPSPPTRRRSRPVDWGRVLESLPASFGLEALAKHPVAGKRPKSHLYAIVSRWKKEGKLVPAAGGGYRKADRRPSKPKRAARAKTVKASPPSSGGETPTA